MNHIANRLEQLFRLNVTAIGFGLLMCVGAATYHGVVVKDKVSHEEMYDHYTYLYQLLTRHSALWDRWIQADALEKKVIQMQLDSIRTELNEYYVLQSTVRDARTPHESYYKFKIFN